MRSCFACATGVFAGYEWVFAVCAAVLAVSVRELAFAAFLLGGFASGGLGC